MKYLDKLIKNRIYLVLVTCVFIYIMDFNQSPSSVWIAPYLSTVANILD